jgi:hypothetical protein
VTRGPRRDGDRGRLRAAASLSLLTLLATAIPIASVACGKKRGSPAASGASGMTREQCDALRASAGASAQKITEDATYLTSDLPCYTADQCVELAAPSCVVGCGGYAVPKAARDTVEKKLRSIDEGDCKKWKDSDCATIAPPPMASCPTYVPACRENRCVMRDKRELLSAAECTALLAEANRASAAALAAADTKCAADDDCVLSTGGCVGGCGGPAVAKRGEAAYKAAHSAGPAATCKRWWDADCMTTTPQPVPSCAPVYARCKDAHCTASMK